MISQPILIRLLVTVIGLPVAIAFLFFLGHLLDVTGPATVFALSSCAMALVIVWFVAFVALVVCVALNQLE